jgi:hypothetical protein
MEDQSTVMLEALNAFANQDYQRCSQIVATVFPKTALVMIQVMLISLQAAGERLHQT